MNTSQDLLFLASSLVDIGSDLLSKRDVDSALVLFDSAHQTISAPSQSSIMTAIKQIHLSKVAQISSDYAKMHNLDAPDIYKEDESDVGPRILPTPIRILDQKVLSSSEQDVTLVLAVTLYNKALTQHLGTCQTDEAKKLYQRLTLQNFHIGTVSNTTRLTPTLGMRVHNNLGVTAYAEGDDDYSISCFSEALFFSRQLAELSHEFQLEHATVLSNWCRVSWMRGDVSEPVYAGLKEILRIRSCNLAWDHPDVAAAHYNLAVAEYSKGEGHEAISHLKHYLHVAGHRRRTSETDDLDPISAMIYLLLIQNEDKDDAKSQELILETRILQDTLKDEARNGSEVALSLNAIGSLLFSKGDLDNALVFFLEELRLEEQLLSVGEEDISVSVTCNNIGRIYQALELYDKAILYFERALKPVYGDMSDHKSSGTTKPRHQCDPEVANLLAAVWYNLGLLHDKRGSCTEAIGAFQMSLHLKKSLVGSSHPDVTCLYFNIGVLLMEEDRLDESQTYLTEALRARPHGQNSNQQLNDNRVTITLTKLATLHKNKGMMQSAIDILIAVICILKVSSEFDTNSRMTGITDVLRSISELYHAKDDLPSALAAAQESVRELELIATAKSAVSKIALAEQVMSSLLLIGSLHYEMCEPIKGDTCVRQAVWIFQKTLEANPDLAIQSSSDLESLRDVALLMVIAQCAPMA